MNPAPRLRIISLSLSLSPRHRTQVQQEAPAKVLNRPSQMKGSVC